MLDIRKLPTNEDLVDPSEKEKEIQEDAADDDAKKLAQEIITKLDSILCLK